MKRAVGRCTTLAGLPRGLYGGRRFAALVPPIAPPLLRQQNTDHVVKRDGSCLGPHELFAVSSTPDVRR
jgi:hypothetical protein